MFNPFKTTTKSFPIDTTSRATIAASTRKLDRHFGARRTNVALDHERMAWVVTKKSIFSR